MKEAKDVAPDVFGAAYKKEGIRGVIPGMGQKKLTKKEIAEFRKERLAKEKREKERRKRNRERAKANPSLLKGGSNFSNGGLADEKKGSRTRSLKGIPERRREANKRRKEQGLEPITSLTGIPERRKDNKKKKSKTPVKKANGGLASAAKTITGGTTRSRNKTKPRGVGVATRGFGKALK